ncbi:putative 28S ribosomal protein S10, partial [Nibea albiflora]
CARNDSLCLCRSHLPSTPSTSFHTATVFSSTPPSVTVTEEPDVLFQKVSMLVKSHDKAVLDSYEFFATMAAKELGITISKVYEPHKDIERLTVLKSIHIFKKHRVQYEMRTHYRCIEVMSLNMSLTGATTMEKIPDHILAPMWKDLPVDDKPHQ